MEVLRCKLCGGSLVMDNSGEFARCEYCGTKYQNEFLQKMIVEIKGNVRVEGIDTIEKMIGDIEALDIIGAINERDRKCTSITELFPADYRSWMTAYKYAPYNIDIYKRAYILAPPEFKVQLENSYNQNWNNLAIQFRNGEKIDYIIRIIRNIEKVGSDTDAKVFIDELIDSQKMISNCFGKKFSVDAFDEPSLYKKIMYGERPKKIQVVEPTFAMFISEIEDVDARLFILKYVENMAFRVENIYVNNHTLILYIQEDYEGSDYVYCKMKCSITKSELSRILRFIENKRKPKK